MKLSVIIPNYNNGEYLSKCLDSVLSQSFQDFEIVISDDCSTDNSVEIINDYLASHSNIKALFNAERVNVSRNRHLAIEASTGDYLTTLDSDDFYYHHQKLELEINVIDHFIKTRGTGVCAFSNIAIVDEHGRFIQQQWLDSAISEGDIFKGIFSRTCMIPRDFIFPRKLYNETGGYDPRFNLYEDWDLKIRLSRLAEFHFSGIVGIAYRRKGVGLSYVPVKQHVNALTEIWEKNRELMLPEETDYINEHFFKHLDFINKNQQ